ncbi:VanZ family protein [Bacteroidia bacterium]|nr:VanZ family protein [Bacteroidia bacterium]
MKVNRAILPAVLWTLFIASSCLLPASAFKKFTFDSLSQLDKLIHLILYVVFVMLWALSLKRVLTIKEKLVLLLVSVAYGVLIEVLQSAMALGRAYDIDDIIANTAGCFLGILLMSFIARKMPLLKNRLPFLR